MAGNRLRKSGWSQGQGFDSSALLQPVMAERFRHLPSKQATRVRVPLTGPTQT